MTRIRDVKTTFTAGEVSKELLGRGDLRAYDNGALALRNVFINPTGGVTRRFGLGYVDGAAGDGKLIAFEFNTQQTALLVLTDGAIDIYSGGVKEASLTTPWSETQIAQIAWTQSADTLLLTHPDTPPKKLIRSGLGGWTLNDWTYFTDENIIFQPFFKFVNSAITITPSADQGTITLTASAPVFTQDHESTRLRVRGIDIEITDFASPTVLTGTVIPKPNPDYDANDVSSEEFLILPNTAATIDWFEQAFSPARGYPATVAFHQDRLVIGGSRDLPNRLWFSKSGDLFNFNLGEGLDDEAIEFSILSDQVNAIRGIFSGRHLQIFTSGAEWQISGDPLTPTSVQIRRQTRTGSRIDRHIPPVNVDGATLFIARSGREVHEFLYTDLEQAYVSTDLALLSRHVIETPIDQDYDRKNRLLFLVREDGKFATLTVFRAEKISAWTLHETNGAVKSVAVVGDEVYMLVERNATFFIEQFDPNLNLDSALSGKVTIPSSQWSGLSHLEGQAVSVVADGAVIEGLVVQNGSLNLTEPVKEVQIGLPYTHKIEPLPPNEVGQVGAGRKLRLIEAIFRVKDTAALRDPSMIAKGVTSNITGSRADIVICDDVEVPNTCDSAQKRNDLRERLAEIAYVMVSGGTQLYVGTPHSYYSIYADMPRTEINEEFPFLDGFKRLVIPLLDKHGQSIWPERYGKHAIEQIKKQTGPNKFESQMMLHPVNILDGRLNPDLLQTYTGELEYDRMLKMLFIGSRKMVGASCWWDPAFGSAKGDNSVFAIVFADEGGNYFLHHIEYITLNEADKNDEATQQARIITEIAKKFYLPSITVEINGIGRFLPNILRNELAKAKAPTRVNEVSSTRPKAVRIIEGFDALMASKRLFIHESVHQTPFMMEMREWQPSAKSARDDGLDAVAGALSLQPDRLERIHALGAHNWTNATKTHKANTNFKI